MKTIDFNSEDSKELQVSQPVAHFVEIGREFIQCHELHQHSIALFTSPPDYEALRQRVAELEKVLDGLPQDAIDGGWTAKGISRCLKNAELERDRLQSECDSLRGHLAGWKAMAALEAPPYQSEQVLNMVWIPVSQRIPDHRNSVLCFVVENDGCKYVKQERLNPAMTAFYVEYDGDEPNEVITHWQELPSAPKGEE